MKTVVHVLYSFGTGGLEKGIATVVNHGSSRFRHEIVCLGQGRASRRLLERNVPVFEMNKPRGHSWRFVLKLASFLRQRRPDVVHTRNWGGMDGVIAARLAGIKAVVHGEHGWDMSDPFGERRSRLWIRRLMDPCIREYTCVSRQMEFWLRDVVGIGVRKTITQISNGIDTVTFRAGEKKEARSKLHLDPSTFVVGTVGRLDPIKDHETLLRAFEIFRRDDPRSVLLVVGDGPERSRLRQLAGDGVRLLGERLDVPWILKALDVFVLTSKNEGISNTILEAMASSLPVLATNVGGTPEVVVDGTTGILVSPGNAEVLASCLKSLAQNPALRERMGTAGRRRVEELFSIESMVDRYQQVWNRVASGA